MPVISVIVPVYKVEPYLRRCIDSILAQTYTDFELILVDDGSTDNCGAICDEYAKQDARIRVIHQENGGLSAARNAGIDAAQGDYLTFIDSDDFIAEGFLEQLWQTAQETAAECVICGMCMFRDGEEVSVQLTSGAAETMSGREACMDIYHMGGNVPVMACGKLYRRELFDGIRYPPGRIHEDDATTPKVLYRAKKISVSSAPLYAYRQREGSITHEKFTEKRLDTIYAVDSCISFFREVGDFDLQHQAEGARQIMLAKLVVRAKQAGAADKLPRQYAMSEWKALRIIRKYASDDVYSWFLSLNHPKLVRPHEYIRKIRQILGRKRENA